MRTGQVPVEGNLVRLRGDMWIVTNVDRRNGSDATVTAMPLDDDLDTLTVVWQAERGTEIIERLALPEPTPGAFDDPEVFDAFLDAVNWGAITSADNRLLQSPFRAGIRIEDYQLVPLLKALGQSRANLLVCDDVGLGKTIEAALCTHEFVLRGRAKQCLIVCPAGLTLKWQQEMADKFGMDFVILDTKEVSRIRRTFGPHVNPLKAHPYTITSIDWLKRPEQQPMIDAVLPVDEHVYPRTFDILIVDEAHNAAASPSNRYVKDTQQTALIRRIGPHFEHKFFLTATPHNGKPESFQSLLELLDNRQFQRGIPPTEAQLEQVMVRRLKSHLAEMARIDGTTSPFAKRVLHPIPLTYSESEHQAYGWLVQYDRLARKQAGDSKTQQQAAGFVTLLMKKRFLSSPRAFRDTLSVHADTVKQHSRRKAASSSTLRDLYDATNDSYADDDAFEFAEDEATSTAVASGPPLTDEQQDLLERMQAWSSQHANGPSAKSIRLFDWLNEVCKPDGAWNDERVVVFTEYRSTLNWLLDLMKSAGLADEGRVGIIHGSVDAEGRDDLTSKFNRNPAADPLRIMLCTEAAAEGIDLHRQCHRLVHFDVPFSPTKMEQRNGRIDRHGQPAVTADIYYFTAEEDDGGPAADTFLLDLIMRKVEQIKDDLGDVNALLSTTDDSSTFSGVQRDLEMAMQGQRRERLKVQQGRAEIVQLRQTLRAGIENARQALHSTEKDLNLKPENIAHTVNVALHLDNQPLLTPRDDQPGVYDLPSGLSFDWDVTLTGLADPDSPDRRRPVTFHAELAPSPLEGPAHLHLAHPLVVRATELLRAQMWSNTATANDLHRVAARTYRDQMLPADHPAKGHVAVVAHARVVITGGDGARLHESVVAIGGRMADRFARFDTLTKTDQVWGARTGTAADDEEELAALWEQASESMMKGIEDRGYEVARQMADRLDARRDEEIARFDQMVADLTTRIRAHLDKIEKDQQNLQIALFPEEGHDDYEQWKADVEAMKRQVDELKDIGADEKQAVIERYAVREPRVFPMTITFLVPQSQGVNR